MEMNLSYPRKEATLLYAGIVVVLILLLSSNPEQPIMVFFQGDGFPLGSILFLSLPSG